MSERNEKWQSLLEGIAEDFAFEELIPHEEMRRRLGFEELHEEDYEDWSSYSEALSVQKLSYLSMVSKVQEDLLTGYKLCLRNVWGEGYVLVSPERQTKYAYDTFLKDTKKSARESSLIMRNVGKVSAEQQQRDNDLRAKFDSMRRFIQTNK